MKRSEMLQVILPYVHTDSPKGELYTAKKLLHKLEDAGMLPPYDDNRKFRLTDNMACCKWEAE